MPEEESEPMKGPKKKKDDFKFKHPWLACSRQYGILALVILVGHILSSILSGMTNVDYFRYPLSETFRHPFNATANLTINRTPIMQGTEIYAAEMYADNARSILCTLVGSEAAIVAIVVSLTLIAIEFTASEYSPRVIDISLKNPDMWILLLIYGVAIFSSILLLKQLPYESRFPTEDVSFAFWLGVFSYVALVPYLRNTIRLFDPTNIVRLVAANIEKDKLLKYIKDLNETSKKDETKTSEDFHPPTKDSAKKTSRNKGDTEGHEENPIQSLLDIVYRSINNYDLETVRNGLEQIEELAKKVIVAYNRDNALGKDNEKLLKKQMRFSKHFCDPLRRISRLAASKDDEESTIEVIKTLQTFGEKTAAKKLIVATEQVAMTLGAVGQISVEKGKAFEDAVKDVASSLEIIGKTAVDNNLEDVVKDVATSLGTVGKAAVDKEKKLEDAVKTVALALKEVGIAAAEDKEKKLENAVTQVASTLGAVGVAATDNGKELEDAAEQVISSIGDVGEAAAKNKLPDATWQAAASLEAVGGAAAKNRLISPALKATEILQNLGEVAVNKSLIKPALKATEALENVARVAADKRKEFEKVTEEVALSIEAIGTAKAEELSRPSFTLEWKVIESLEAVGVVVVQKNLADAAVQVALSLESVVEAVADAEVEALPPETAVEEKRLKSIPRRAVVALETLGKLSGEKNYKEATDQIVTSIGVVGQVGLNKNLGDTVSQAVSSLVVVGTIALSKEELKDIGEHAACSLARLKTLNQQILETEISNYNRHIKEDYIDSFKKFIELYLQCLGN